MEVRIRKLTLKEALGYSVDLFGSRHAIEIRQVEPARVHRNKVVVAESPEVALSSAFKAVGAHIRQAILSFDKNRSV